MKIAHLIFSLFISLISINLIFSQSKDLLQQQFDQQIAEVNQLAKSGQLQEAIAKGQQAKEFAFENFKDSNRNKISILNKLNFYYRFLNDYENELDTNIELFKIRNEDLKQEQAVFAKSFKNLVDYYNTIDNQKDIIPVFKDANERLIKQTEEAFEFRFEDERAAFLQNNIQPYLDLFQSFAYQTNYKYQYLNNQLTNNVLITKGALLNSSKDILKVLETLNDDIITKKINEYRGVKDFVSYQLSLKEAERAKELFSKQARLIGLESELVLYYRRNSQEKFSLEKNWRRTQLKENEIAIEFTRFNYHNTKWTDSIIYVAHIFKKTSRTPKLIPLFEETQLQHILDNTSPNEVYNSRGSKSKRLNKNAVEDLYSLIIEPLTTELNGNTTIYFSPDGLLHQIAFAALKDSNGRLLMEDYNLIQVNSSAVIKRTPKQPKSETALFIGGIDYNYKTEGKTKVDNAFIANVRGFKSNRGKDELWPYLKGTKAEADTLKTLFDSKGKNSRFLSAKAADENALKQLSGKSPNILHIATHGFFYENSSKSLNNQDINNEYKTSDNPLLRSGLLLAGANYAWKNGNNPYEEEDGILTALEISNLDLSDTDLVALSACETGLGDIIGNEGVYGLQRAFKMAGVNMIMMSLWEVPDIETAEFMTNFYEIWLENNTIRQAFVETQRKMHNLYPNNPEKWAAFVLFE
jgi:CHAT domain-containing protein